MCLSRRVFLQAEASEILNYIVNEFGIDTHRETIGRRRIGLNRNQLMSLKVWLPINQMFKYFREVSSGPPGFEIFNADNDL